MLLYVQTSQPTTCFGLFQLDHLQFGHKGQRNYTIMHYYHSSQGGRDLVYKFGACVQTGGIEIYALKLLVCGNIFFHYWWAPEGARGSCIVGR